LCVPYDTHMMNLTFSDIEKPADLEKFQKITYPTFFFGFAIRTMYDQKRLKIKKEYNPNYIVHKYGNKADEMIFLYGMLAPVSNDVMPYILPLRANPNVNHEQYEAVIRPLEVECSDCYLFLAKNLYPINSFYAHRFFTKSNFKNINNYSELFDRDPELPLHHTISPFYLFLLTNY